MRHALALALVLCLPLSAQASDPDKPHPHAQVFTPITTAPDAASLNAEERATLDEGDVVLQQQQGEDAGWGLAVQYIEAPADVVWDTILGYDHYPDRVKGVKTTEIYKREGPSFWLDMQCSTAGIKYGLYTINSVYKEQGWMAWVLDRDRKSDVYDMIGYWRVEQVRTDPPLTRLDYFTQMKIRGVPGFLMRHLTGGALEDGTAWVKKYSEQTWGSR